ncbi:MAG TPA: ABC transporter permease [Anaerolineales bacterium]|nr:ABC transporter permease [Anaerolineales bacterium]
MKSLADMIWIELRKVLRSRVPLFTALGFLMMPLIGALLIFIFKDPQLARQLGLLGAKANLVVGSADWPGYLTLMVEFTALGGFFFFCIAISWVFGREFTDGTLKDLLAVPVPRASILLAKFIVSAIWCLALIVETYLVGLALGAVIQLPGGSPAILLHGTRILAVTAAMSITLVLPFGFFASLGRGYLLPIGLAVLTAILGNLSITLGWGEYFPWAVPGLYMQALPLTWISYILVILTGLAGLAGTYIWWKFTDQNR